MAQRLGPNMAALEELTLSPGELTNHSLYSNKGVYLYVHACAYMHERVHVSDALFWPPRVLHKCVQRKSDPTKISK